MDVSAFNADAAQADVSFSFEEAAEATTVKAAAKPSAEEEPQPQRSARRSRVVPTGSFLAGRVDVANAALLDDLRRCVLHA